MAHVLRRVGFLRRVVALWFPLSVGCDFCSDMHNFSLKTNIKQIITKQQSVYAVAVYACELASWATDPWNVLWASLRVLHVFPQFKPTMQ